MSAQVAQVLHTNGKFTARITHFGRLKNKLLNSTFAP